MLSLRNAMAKGRSSSLITLFELMSRGAYQRQCYAGGDGGDGDDDAQAGFSEMYLGARQRSVAMQQDRHFGIGWLPGPIWGGVSLSEVVAVSRLCCALTRDTCFICMVTHASRGDYSGSG